VRGARLSAAPTEIFYSNCGEVLRDLVERNQNEDPAAWATVNPEVYYALRIAAHQMKQLKAAWDAAAGKIAAT
ncbi:unnamed protein product, partial [Amoebophrya sp. A120]